MGTCGFPTCSLRQRGEGGSRSNKANHGKPHRWAARTVIGVIFLGLVVGCAPTIKYGSPPRTDRLSTLKPGISTTEDILQALGEPRGHGMARWIPIDLRPRKIWFYEYTEARDRRVTLKILLVFIQQERYEGHLWFSSANLVQLTE